MSRQQAGCRAFTLIEVVLAIAVGLIIIASVSVGYSYAKRAAITDDQKTTSGNNLDTFQTLSTNNSVPTSQTQNTTSRQGTATIDKNSLTSYSNTPVISGSAENVQKVYLVVLNENGDLEVSWGGGSAAEVSSGHWSFKKLPVLPNGRYTVKIGDESTNTVLTTGTLTIRSTAQTTLSVSGMSKYIDTDFGFSFWYPSGWTVTKSSTMSSVDIRDAEYKEKLFVSNGKGDTVVVAVFSSTNRSITDSGGAGPFGPVRYYFDPNTHLWMKVGQPDGAPSEFINATTTANVSIRTMGGLYMLAGTTRYNTSIIPLSAQNFVVVNDDSGLPGGGARNLARTIVALDPSVATALSVAEQIVIIKAEADAFNF